MLDEHKNLKQDEFNDAQVQQLHKEIFELAEILLDYYIQQNHSKKNRDEKPSNS